MPSGTQYIGMVLWVAQKSNDLKAAYDLWEATQSADAALNVFAELSEIAAGVGVGIAVNGLVDAMQKTGLSRVFDSIRKDQTLEEYRRNQGVGKSAASYVAGEATDAFIDYARDYVSENQILDPVFDFFHEIANADIGANLNNLFNSARAWVQQIQRDPLTLDLDGDGIETIAANGSVLFDHDGDGVKNGSGWIKADDGLLVLDRNGNGTIDSGRELFGADTLKSNGQLATSGFEALKDLDSNNDNIFNASDAQFNNVRVWRDLNQDGISQSNELFTLSALNIKAINLVPTSTADVNLGNGNFLAKAA